MSLPRSSKGLREAVIGLLALMEGPFIILTPTGRHLEADIASLLARVGAVHLPLVDILGVNGAGLLEALSPPDEILRDFRLSVAPQPQAGSSLELFPTPPAASWEQIIMEFHADEVMLIKCGSAFKRVEPEHLGMKNRKSGKPTLQWTLLRTLAQTNGIIPLQSPKDHDRVKKQKSELSRKLKAYFQLQGDPIEWKQGEYLWESLFRIRTVNLRESSSEVRQ